MSRDKSAHIDAPITFKIGSDTYQLSQLRLREFRQLEKHLRQQAVEEIKPSLTGLPLALQESMLAKAVDRGRKIKLGSDDFKEAAGTFEGMTFILYLGLQRNHPQMTLDECDELLTDNIEAIAPILAEAAGQAETNPSVPATTTLPA